MDSIGNQESIDNNLIQHNKSEQDNGDDSNHEIKPEDVVPKEECEDHPNEEASADSLTYLAPKPSNYRVTPELGDKDEELHTKRGVKFRDNLEQPERRGYSLKALPEAILSSNETKLNESLSSLERHEWITAMNKKIETLIEIGTWKATKTMPVSVKVLLFMILSKLKQEEQRNPAMIKSRLVALGNMQKEISLCMDLYAPVICIDLVRALLSAVQIKQWSIRHVDFKGAFQNAHFDEKEDIWIKLPKVSITKFFSQVVKLVKSLYGLRQASKLRYD